MLCTARYDIVYAKPTTQTITARDLSLAAINAYNARAIIDSRRCLRRARSDSSLYRRQNDLLTRRRLVFGPRAERRSVAKLFSIGLAYTRPDGGETGVILRIVVMTPLFFSFFLSFFLHFLCRHDRVTVNRSANRFTSSEFPFESNGFSIASAPPARVDTRTATKGKRYRRKFIRVRVGRDPFSGRFSISSARITTCELFVLQRFAAGGRNPRATLRAETRRKYAVFVLCAVDGGKHTRCVPDIADDAERCEKFTRRKQ